MFNKNLSDEQKIIFTISHLLNSVDKLEWNGYKECFIEGEVILDYTSLNGGEPYQGTIDTFIDLVNNLYQAIKLHLINLPILK